MLSRVPIRVILGEDSSLVREGAAAGPRGRSQLVLEAECGDADSLLHAIEEHGPTSW